MTTNPEATRCAEAAARRSYEYAGDRKGLHVYRLGPRARRGEGRMAS